MKTTAISIATAAIGLAGFTYADEIKEPTPMAVTGPTLMADAEMTSVVAGKEKFINTPGTGFKALNSPSREPGRVAKDFSPPAGPICISIGDNTQCD